MPPLLHVRMILTLLTDFTRDYKQHCIGDKTSNFERLCRFHVLEAAINIVVNCWNIAGTKHGNCVLSP